MSKKVALSRGGAPHLTGRGVYEMLAIRCADLSKERKKLDSQIALGVFTAFFLSVATLLVVSDKIVFDLMVKLSDLVKVVLYEFFFISESYLTF